MVLGSSPVAFTKIVTDVNTFLLGEFISFYFLYVNPEKLTLCPTTEIEGRDPTNVYGPTMTWYLKKWSSWSLWKVNKESLIVVKSF